MPLLFLSHVLYSTLIDWLIFKGSNFLIFQADLIRFLQFHIVLSEILSAAFANQLLYNLSLIKSYLA